MIHSDCHMHSSISSDSEAQMEDMIKGAVEKHLNTICFTEHMDYNFPDNYEYDFQFDPEEYFDKINELADKYSEYITVLKGVEIGLMPGTEEKYAGLLRDYQWDYVIGSTHIISSVDPYYPEYWEGQDEKTCIKRYFDTVYENIVSFSGFDSLGHLDYIIRYAPHKNSGFHISDYKDIIDKILRFIINNNIALEINSSGYRAGLDEPNPCKDIIQRYIELGGNLYTFGSDAHDPGYIAGYFEHVCRLMESMGIHKYYIYKQRRPFLVHI